MDRKKSIVISGYYGFNNIGDEAVLSSIVTALRKHIPDVHITVLSNAPSQTKALYGVDAVDRWQIKEIAKVIKASDLLISGGGSLLQDTTSNKVIPYYLGIVKIAQWYKKPVVFYSQGVGPVAKGLGKWLIKTIGNKVTKIFVRDEGSKALLESIGVKKAPITVTIDPVLGIKVKPELVNQLVPNLVTGKKVGIYIRPWKNDKELVDKLKEVVKYMVDKDYDIYLMPMYHKEDLSISEELANHLGERVHVIRQEMTIDEVVAYTAQFDFILGMRLHSLIMAHAVGVPMIGLSYDPKVEGFLKEVHASYCVDVHHLNITRLKEYIDELAEHLEEEKQRIDQVNQEKEQKVELPAEYIKQLLG